MNTATKTTTRRKFYGGICEIEKLPDEPGRHWVKVRFDAQGGAGCQFEAWEDELPLLERAIQGNFSDMSDIVGLPLAPSKKTKASMPKYPFKRKNTPAVDSKNRMLACETAEATMIEVAKAGTTVAACPHSLTVDKLSMIRHHIEHVAGGWRFQVAIACFECEDKIPYPIKGNGPAIDAAVEHLCHKQITLNCDLHLLSDGTIVTCQGWAPDDTESLELLVQQVEQMHVGNPPSVKEASR